jgi:hypothetical protein
MDLAAGHGTRSCHRTEQDGTLGRIHLELALGAGKLTANAGRLLRVGGGTSLPGNVARRIAGLRGLPAHGPLLPAGQGTAAGGGGRARHPYRGLSRALA